MDFIGLSPFFPIWVGFLGLALFSAGIVALVLLSKKDKQGTKPWQAFVSLGIVVILGEALAIGGLAPGGLTQHAQLREEIKRSYGIELTSKEDSALRYPTTRPESDFQSYGSFERMLKVDGTLIKREIYLIWEDGKFYLAQSANGEEFTPLEAKI